MARAPHPGEHRPRVLGRRVGAHSVEYGQGVLREVIARRERPGPWSSPTGHDQAPCGCSAACSSPAMRATVGQAGQGSRQRARHVERRAGAALGHGRRSRPSPCVLAAQLARAAPARGARAAVVGRTSRSRTARSRFAAAGSWKARSSRRDRRVGAGTARCRCSSRSPTRWRRCTKPQLAEKTAAGPAYEADVDTGYVCADELGVPLHPEHYSATNFTASPGLSRASDCTTPAAQ
jgi:hypothetical protein